MAKQPIKRFCKGRTDHRYSHEVQSQNAYGKTHTKVVDYNQTGTVWQAEEDNGQYYYGFVGPHDLMRLSGQDIEFPALYSYAWAELSSGLDCHVEAADTAHAGDLVSVTVSLRNRSGLPQTVPTKFVRSGPNGPLLRSGITMTLLYSPVDKDAQGWH